MDRYELNEAAKPLSERKCAVDPLVMRNRRDIADSCTNVIARRLHYFDKMDTIDFATCKASDILELENGAIDRYRNDPIFHAKVTSIVADLMRVLFA